jgi:hypothetical protein
MRLNEALAEGAVSLFFTPLLLPMSCGLFYQGVFLKALKRVYFDR